MVESSPVVPELPEVDPIDPEPVAVAIETARALFRSGEQMEALRWLRRAAERAEESGDDLRALNLARSAADLSTALQSLPPPPASPASVPPPAPPPPRASVPPPPPPPPAISAPPAAPTTLSALSAQVPPAPPAPPAPRASAPAPAPPAPPAPRASAPPPAPPPPVPAPHAVPTQAPPTPRRIDEAVALSPYDDFSDKTQVDAKAPLREALQSGVQITEMPAPVDAAPRSVTMPSPPSSEPTVANAQYRPVVELKRPATRSAVRVAVTRDPASADTWLLRALPEDSPVPPGCEEALLVALNPKSRLLQ